MTHSPYAGELPAFGKAENVDAALHARATQRHLQFATEVLATLKTHLDQVSKLK